MMDYKEAIEIIRKDTCGCPQFLTDGMMRKCNDACMYGEDKCAYNVAISAMQELEKYKKFGTLEEVREAVEKQKAKKPILDKPLMILECPSCGNYLQKVVDYEGSTDGFIQMYCSNCGQKIDADWTEVEE